MIIKHSKTKEVLTTSATSLNAAKGKTVSELESSLLCFGKLLEEKLANKSVGVIVNKGQDDQVKIKYEDALRGLNRLSSYFGLKGTFSYGICGTCNHFSIDTDSTEVLGTCKLKSSSGHHIYESCAQHSKYGGGYGL